MICPHCQTSLLHRFRSGRTCSRCRRPFALEPKESPFRLHDLRVRRLAEKLADGRGLQYTGPQLYFAAGRKTLPKHGSGYAGLTVALSLLTVLGGVLLMIGGVLPVAAGIVALVGAIVLLNVVLRLLRPFVLRRSRVRLATDYHAFSAQVLGPWHRVYRAPPPGLTRDHFAPPSVPRLRIALLCPDRSTLVCLAANGAADTWQMALCERPEQVPPEVPVLVLHDASVAGIEWARRAREVLGPRAVPLGLSPASVRTAAWAVRMKERPVPAVLPPALGDEDRRWLLDGWWSPAAALPPARLLRLVQRGVDRVEEAADPDRRRAGEVGFLTWPTPA